MSGDTTVSRSPVMIDRRRLDAGVARRLRGHEGVAGRPHRAHWRENSAAAAPALCRRARRSRAAASCGANTAAGDRSVSRVPTGSDQRPREQRPDDRRCRRGCSTRRCRSATDATPARAARARRPAPDDRAPARSRPLPANECATMIARSMPSRLEQLRRSWRPGAPARRRPPSRSLQPWPGRSTQDDAMVRAEPVAERKPHVFEIAARAVQQHHRQLVGGRARVRCRDRPRAAARRRPPRTFPAGG